jgi:ATP-dependent Clp protease ATP-binding subunit ClpA
MLSKNLEETLHRALAHANARQHELATLEHLLLSLTEDQDAVSVLRACNVDIERLRRSLEEFLDEELGGLAVDQVVSDAKPTASFQRVIQRAVHHVQMSGREEVTGANVLVAIFSERARGLLPPRAGHDPARCGQLHQPRHRQGARGVGNARPRRRRR